MATYLHHEPSWRPGREVSRSSAHEPHAQVGWPEAARPAPASPDPADQQPPMGVGKLYGVALRILRQRYRSLLAISLIVVGPAMLLSLITGVNYDLAWRDVYGDSLSGGAGLFPTDEELEALELATMSATDAQLDAIESTSLVSTGAGLLETLFFTIVTLGFAAIVAADFYARSVSTRVGLVACRQRWLSSIVVLIVIGVAYVGIGIVAALIFLAGALVAGAMGDSALAFVAILAGLAAGIVVLLVPLIRWSVVLAAMAIEDIGFGASLSRSWDLTKRQTLRTFAVWILPTLAVFVLDVFAPIAATELLMGTVGESFGWDPLIVAWISSSATILLTLPVVGVVMAVLYFDLRARSRTPAPEASPWGVAGAR